MKYKVLVIILLIVPLIISAKTSDHVVISEIMISGGTGKTTDEFVELYNPTGQDVDLSGWSLIKKTASGSEYELVQDFGELKISSNSYLLIAHPTGYLGEVAPDIIYSSGSSLATNNTVILYDDGNIVDLVGMGSVLEYESAAASNPGTNKSIERKALADSDEDSMLPGEVDSGQGNGYDSDENGFDFIPRADPDPQNAQSDKEFIGNIIINANELSKAYSDQIVITEIFPNPTGSDNEEFIEIFNSGQSEVDLTDWELGDNSTNLFNFDDVAINPGQYLVVDKELSGISLNNTGDSVNLFDPNGETKSKVEYFSCQEGMSYALVEGTWQWTSSVTPGQENKVVIDNEPPEAFFALDKHTFMVGEEILLDGSSSSDPDGDDLIFTWLIIGQELTGEKVKYSFQTAGELKIVLSVQDVWGESSQFSIDVKVVDYDYSDQVFLTELLPSCEGADEDCEYVELFNNDDRTINMTGWSLTDTKKIYKFEEGVFIDARDYLVVRRDKSGITLNNDADTIYLMDPGGQIIAGVEYGQAPSDQAFALLDGTWHWTSEPTPGDENIITGEIVEAESEEEIDMTPMNVAIKDLNEELLGRMIIISGEVESASKKGIYLMDEFGNTIRIYIQEKTGLDWPEVDEGDFMEVTGLLDKTSAGMRLLPQTEDDIAITRVTKEDDSEDSEPKVLGVSVEKKDLDILPNSNTQQVVYYLYLIIGILLVVIVVISVKYFTGKKTAQEIDEDVYLDSGSSPE